MPVESGARTVRDNLRFVEGDGKVEGFEVCETVTVKGPTVFYIN
jgi:hypothetical protein